METFFSDTIKLIGAYVPTLLGAIAIIIVGWIVARILASVSRKLLHGMKFNEKMGKWLSRDADKQPIDAEHGTSRGIFYLAMLFVLGAFFQTLGTTQMTEPINGLLNKIFSFAPQMLGAGVLLILALVLASVVKALVFNALKKTSLDERLSPKTASDAFKDELAETSPPAPAMSKNISETTYWLILFLFLPAILGALNLEGILGPIQGMIDKTLAFLPNLIAAAAIAVVGWFIAKLVQQIATNLLAAAGVDNLSEKVGLAGALSGNKLSRIIGIVVNALVFIPCLIASLNVLAIDAVSQPASNMLNMILSAIPNIFAAGLIIGISFVIGKLAAGLTSNLLSSVGFNEFMVKIGLKAKVAEGERTPSIVAGNLVLLAIVLFSAIEASGMMGFEILGNLISQFMVFAGQVVFGLAILALGLYLAGACAKIIQDSNLVQRDILATSAKIGILILTGSMALRQMGFANEIITLAFGLTLGSVAVAAAIAFGVGGRDLAARKLNEWQFSLSPNREWHGEERRRSRAA